MVPLGIKRGDKRGFVLAVGQKIKVQKCTPKMGLLLCQMYDAIRKKIGRGGEGIVLYVHADYIHLRI